MLVLTTDVIKLDFFIPVSQGPRKPIFNQYADAIVSNRSPGKVANELISLFLVEIMARPISTPWSQYSSTAYSLTLSVYSMQDVSQSGHLHSITPILLTSIVKVAVA